MLIETPDENRARALMEAALDPIVAGSRPVPRRLLEPELVLKSIWALPDHSPHALGDSENHAPAGGR